jgi:hypothetical protein
LFSPNNITACYLQNGLKVKGHEWIWPLTLLFE